jgi:nucleoside-diphosphate-sugar epimerase
MFTENKLYSEDIAMIGECAVNWQVLKNKKIAISGASGLIGTFLIDVLMYRNNHYKDNITIYALGRSIEKINRRFKDYLESPFFVFCQQDLQQPLYLNTRIDYIIHGASNTHPLAYANDPINTVLLSIIGTKNIFDFAVKSEVKRILFLSSVEIYGENRGDVESFTEDYCGYIDSNTLRAGYPEGKRAAEALCQAYIDEKHLNIIIARCCRVYGPTMGDEDSKVIAQFIRNVCNNEPIVLKSKGTQQYSYCYVADICCALLLLLLQGENGEAYNIADPKNKESLSEIAGILSEYIHTDIVFEIPSVAESAGYSKATKALLDSGKLQKLGWKPEYQLKNGLLRTVEILKDL